jgi:protein translocase SecG subunit
MNTLIIATVAVSIILIILIALQEQSSDTPGAFGGGAGGSGNYHTRRGLEKFMFGATVFCGVLFVCLAVLNLVIPVL